MKKMMLFVIYILANASLFAPGTGEAAIFREEPIAPYQKLWEAICLVESHNNPTALNRKEMAFGVAQIRECRLRDYVKRTGKQLTLKDCYDYKTSKSIFMFYVSKFQPDDILGISRMWNGKSVKNKYYHNVLKALI
jgi:Transglycosylase SLT domain.